ncbi:MAG: glycoside hydrolase family 28 protein [Chloroflexi bacterium]|nr:glycoside hydrolase family 28 protein [Chloroflexota bacterium]
MNQPSTSFNIRDYGARGDGATLDTRALQSAIDAAAQTGGGTILVPAGQYVTGSIFLRDNTTLYLDAGAVLLGSENAADYPIVTARWEGVTQDTHAPLIAAENARNIALVGRGTIDGRGAIWWQKHRAKTLDAPRPRLISFSSCSNVLIEGVTLINSPAWTINPVRCENVTVNQVTIINPPDSPNTDGINPDSSRNVHISNCHVDVGDDCVTIKSGIETESPGLRVPCENITVTNCTMVHGHGGVVIGSEMSGGVRNVVISNCVFVGTDRGIRIKSRRGRGGFVEDVRVTNVVMREVLCPFTINLYYHINKRGDKIVSDKNARLVDEGTPRVRHIHLSHITARDAKIAAGFVYGLPEMPIEDLTLDDVSITMARDAPAGYADMADDIPEQRAAGFFARNVRGLRLRDVEIADQIGEAFLIESVSRRN